MKISTIFYTFIFLLILERRQRIFIVVCFTPGYIPGRPTVGDTAMINQYKRLDVYRCKLQSHQRFEGRVSVYHVLKVKRCLPEGCFYFKWRCRLLEKGGICKKGYKHAGKNCQGCSYFVDEKIHKVPVFLLSEAERGQFELELEDFENWLESNLGRRLEIYGRVNFVGPWLRKDVYSNRCRVSLRGFLANFAECYLGRTHFEDFVYLRLSPKTQARLELSRGDLVEFEAELALDNGRLVLVRPRSVEFLERASSRSLKDNGEALVAARTATVVDDQNDRCLNCERGRLVDVVCHGPTRGPEIRRQLFCLEGVGEPELCCYQALKELSIRRQA